MSRKKSRGWFGGAASPPPDRTPVPWMARLRLWVWLKERANRARAAPPNPSPPPPGLAFLFRRQPGIRAGRTLTEVGLRHVLDLVIAASSAGLDHAHSGGAADSHIEREC